MQELLIHIETKRKMLKSQKEEKHPNAPTQLRPKIIQTPRERKRGKKRLCVCSVLVFCVAPCSRLVKNMYSPEILSAKLMGLNHLPA